MALATWSIPGDKDTFASGSRSPSPQNRCLLSVRVISLSESCVHIHVENDNRRAVYIGVMAQMIYDGVFYRAAIVARFGVPLVVSLIGAGPCFATDCDPGLTGVSGHPLGYRQRVGRCEGIYWEPHSARDKISVLSYTNGQLPAETAIQDSLPLGWVSTSAGHSRDAVRLRAASLTAAVFYRMDAIRPHSPSTYPWPTDVLRKVDQLTLGDLGFIAATREKVGEVNWTIHLPVSVGIPPPRSPSLALTLAATAPIRDLSWGCLRIEPTGLPGEQVASGRLPGALQMLEPVHVKLPMRAFSGLCYLEIRADVVGGGAGPLITSIVISVPRTEP